MFLWVVVLVVSSATAFVSVPQSKHDLPCAKKDDWKEEQMNEQYAILARRRNAGKREEYFQGVIEKRQQATKDQYEKWRFQRETGEDPLVAWKKLREEGKIGDLKTGLGTDGVEREGGLPLPLPSFGVGGEAGVGGQYDNGERFDLRLPYVDQGYVDPDADVMGKLVNFFKGGNKDPDKEVPDDKKSKSAFRWPWEA